MTLNTESDNPASRDVDKLPASDIVKLINAEDAKVAAAVKTALPQVAQAVDTIVQALSAGGRLFYIGAGTSGRLGVLDAVECVPTFSAPPQLVQGIIAGGDAALTEAVEGAEDDPLQARRDMRTRGVTAADVVCGIAASGHTPYVVGALNYARELGAATIAVACNPGSSIGALAAVSISVDLGPEIISGSTRMKAGSAQKMILNMLSTATMIRLGKVYGNLMVDLKVTNQKLAQRANRLVRQITGVDEDNAERLLAQANNEVKTAVVMQMRHVDAESARNLLTQSGGRLRQVIGHIDAGD